MFDFAWSEIALIGVVALVAIGPKDMPVAIKTIADLVKKGRRMAGEFQTHVDEMVREANLHEVRDQIKDLRSLNIRDQITRAVDGDGTLRRTLSDDPLRSDPLRSGTTAASRPGASVAADAIEAERDVAENGIGLPRPAAVPAPSFLPPGTAAPEAVHPALAAREAAPSFIPPGSVMTAGAEPSTPGPSAPRSSAPDPSTPGPSTPDASTHVPSVAGVAPAGPPAPEV
jgi:sec-independent protein translocase protein TatB